MRKAILMRSARKVMLEERERDAAARLRNEEEEEEDEEEEEIEERGDGEVVDPASVALPESPMVGGVSFGFVASFLASHGSPFLIRV